MRSPAARRLESWKEIAEYLGREVRTVIRWEKERGLPVHRIPGGKRAGVFADSEEIDCWLKGATPRLDEVGPDGEGSGSPVASDDPRSGSELARVGSLVDPAPRAARRRPWLLAAVAAVGVLVALLWSFRPSLSTPREVASVSLESGALLAKGADGSVLWRYAFGRPVLQVRDSNAAVIHEAADLDGDGIAEHLMNVPWLDASSVVAAHELSCFSATGKPLWSIRLSDELAFGAGRYGGPWVGVVAEDGSKGVATFDIQGSKRIAWVQNHYSWWPAILTVLDSRGRTVSKWIHAGSIRAVASLRGDPPLLLVVGTSNSRTAAFLAVLDARDVSGSGPEEPGSPYECHSCPPGRPLRYFVFPPSELTLAYMLPYNHGVVVRVLSDSVEVQTQEVDPRFKLRGLFRFSLDFRLQHAAWSDGWLLTHRRLEREGKIDHTVEGCGEAKRPPRVLAWEPGKGFSEVSATEPMPVATVVR